MKGYKAFESNLTCRGFQYEVGKSYEMEEPPIICQQGFHFCRTISETYYFYDTLDGTRICEVEAYGQIVTDNGIKFCTNKIKIVREITDELERRADIGNNSTGYCNTGSLNTGNRNMGMMNTGNRNAGTGNAGDCNAGDGNTGNNNRGGRNTGNYNCGFHNTGSFNSGWHNAGNRNIGDRNTGDWNTGNNNFGCFCTNEPTFMMFGKPSDWSYRDWCNSLAHDVLDGCPTSETEWIYLDKLTDEELVRHPVYKVLGGHLEVVYCNVSRQKWWNNLEEWQKEAVLSLPNFDADIFWQCTGIKVEEEGEDDC